MRFCNLDFTYKKMYNINIRKSLKFKYLLTKCIHLYYNILVGGIQYE